MLFGQPSCDQERNGAKTAIIAGIGSMPLKSRFCFLDVCQENGRSWLVADAKSGKLGFVFCSATGTLESTAFTNSIFY
ncbi:hypothetical protein [Mesorhizobium prunaredense]|uniref:hypothetical protein n=1 Tax=Mesorhizobium prunaredense TaxID=1631249 RepID=UPI00117F86BA|nr:hypothetical protein [Mesorhizobium prunaredense]